MGFFLTLLHSQLFVTPTYPTASFAGKTVIVTGSNGGLGLEAARHFARLGCAKLILAVRSVEKGEKAREDILASTKCKADAVEVWLLDLGNCESIKQFVRRAQGLARVDALVENAGISGGDWKVLDGRESVLQVNVVGTLLMALMMLPKLRETAREFKTQPRLEVVSSELYYVAKFPERKAEDIYAALNDEKMFKKRDRYQVSKLMEVLFVRELSKYVWKEEVVVDCVNPGLCRSELTRNETGVVKVMIAVGKGLLGRTTEVGSRTLVAGVTTDEGSHGKYMSDCEVQEVSAWVRSEEGRQTQKKVYDQTLALLDRIEPGVSKNI